VFKFLRGLYSCLLVFAIPILLGRLWWKGIRNPAYRERWGERFGLGLCAFKPGGLWIHAVSLGESIAAIPMIRQLQQKFPDLPVLVTTTTPTGSAAIRNALGDSVSQTYFPYDIPWVLKRFLAAVKPSILIILETELWPNCLDLCKKQGVSVIIVNACLSLKSMKGYQWMAGITREMLNNVSLVAAQSMEDGDRYLTLGLAKDRLVITGSMKFDVPVKEEQVTEGKALKSVWKRPVFVAASTHSGEETQVLMAFKKILNTIPEILLILVPRHPERLKEILALIKENEYSVVTRSSGLTILPETKILLVDTLGELSVFYAASDIAFVGGSLVPIGGHNALEAAVLGIPVIVGPYIDNITDVVQLLSGVGALVQIKDSDSLSAAVIHWLQSPEERFRLGDNGRKAVEKNRGALEKVVGLILAQWGSMAQGSVAEQLQQVK